MVYLRHLGFVNMIRCDLVIKRQYGADPVRAADGSTGARASCDDRVVKPVVAFLRNLEPTRPNPARLDAQEVLRRNLDPGRNDPAVPHRARRAFDLARSLGLDLSNPFGLQKPVEAQTLWEALTVEGLIPAEHGDQVGWQSVCLGGSGGRPVARIAEAMAYAVWSDRVLVPEALARLIRHAFVAWRPASTVGERIAWTVIPDSERASGVLPTDPLTELFFAHLAQRRLLSPLPSPRTTMPLETGRIRPLGSYESLALSALRSALHLDGLREANARVDVGPSLNKFVRDLPDLPGLILDLWASGFCLVDLDENGIVLGMPEVHR